MKQCRKCLQNKDFSEFNKQTRAKDGFHPFCRPCRKKDNKERYLRLEDKIIKQVKLWQKKNPDRVKAAKDKYRNKKAQTVSCVNTVT